MSETTSSKPSPAARKAPPTPVAPQTSRVSAEITEEQIRARLKVLSRRGFAVAGLSALGALFGWRWLHRADGKEGTLAWPLRRALQANEAISSRLFSHQRLAPTFSEEAVGELRTNGMAGLQDEDFEPAAWRLALEGVAAGNVSLDLAALQSLPRTEMITEFKCIEGWSTVARWAGVRFADLARVHPPATRSGRPFDPARPDDVPPYLSMATPDGDYYVGLDAASAMHPQTLLAWEMNGEPLSADHGAPLRLVTPVKYGIKNIKRIGVIAWRDARPADYWAERGYDWFAGL